MEKGQNVGKGLPEMAYISHAGKGQDLPCCIAKTFGECSIVYTTHGQLRI